MYLTKPQLFLRAVSIGIRRAALSWGLLTLVMGATNCLAASDPPSPSAPTDQILPKKNKPKKKLAESGDPKANGTAGSPSVALPKNPPADTPPGDVSADKPTDDPAGDQAKDPSSEAVGNEPQNAPVTKPRAGKSTGDDNGAKWVITIKDSTTMNFGPVKVVKRANMRAVNPSGKITGDYTGTFTFQDTQKVREADASVDGTSTTIGKNLKFTLLPYMNPLVQPKGDLTPLVKPGDGPDYQGEGTMEWVTQGSGTAEAEGRKTSDSYGRKDKITFKIVVTGSLAKMILPSPQGEIYLNGSIQKGGGSGDDFKPEPLKVPQKSKDGFKPEPLKVPKKNHDPFVPEPLNVPK